VKICVCNCVSVTVAGAVFATVTVLTAEDPTLPSASVAVALRLTDPSGTVVVFHETVYGAAAATPKEVLPAKNSTCVESWGKCQSLRERFNLCSDHCGGMTCSMTIADSQRLVRIE
jgi:hypothetical protein